MSPLHGLVRPVSENSTAVGVEKEFTETGRRACWPECPLGLDHSSPDKFLRHPATTSAENPGDHRDPLVGQKASLLQNFSGIIAEAFCLPAFELVFAVQFCGFVRQPLNFKTRFPPTFCRCNHPSPPC